MRFVNVGKTLFEWNLKRERRSAAVTLPMYVLFTSLNQLTNEAIQGNDLSDVNHVGNY